MRLCFIFIVGMIRRGKGLGGVNEWGWTRPGVIMRRAHSKDKRIYRMIGLLGSVLFLYIKVYI